MEIQHKQFPATLAITMRQNVQKRAEIHTALADLACKIPTEQIAGPPFCIFNFITSVKDGYDVTLGIPVTQEIENKRLKSELLPKMEVLSILHRDEPEKLGESLGKVFAYANQYAIISDEFYREVYLAESDPGGTGTEIQFVIHNWNAKLAAGLERVLGAEARETVMQGSQSLEIESGLDERFKWVKGMLARLDGLADDHQKWDLISGCAHVFPQGQIDKLATVFKQTRAQTGDPLQAVDAVIAFMDTDPGWAEGGLREGYTVYAAKKPRDAKAYAEAQSDLERRQAYCYCPLVRTKIDQGMPLDFCNCGSGWFRQQWEGATGKPVTMEIVQSVLRGDEKCEFAIHLAKDI
jgi:effector-binding domain-containing protein